MTEAPTIARHRGEFQILAPLLAENFSLLGDQ